MSLMCQKDSYLKEFHTKIKSCQPSTATLVENGKKTKVKGYDVILEDTILFPEGGGQPDDRGTINDVPVKKIIRSGEDAVHFVLSELTAKAEAVLSVDWERRFDHMQQHTAQHLVTATADHKFGFGTTSWSLGPDIVTIELDTPNVTLEQLEEIEKSVNRSIRNGVPVKPCLYKDKTDPELEKFRGLGLPADHVGPVRVVTIEGIDSALCCGTHISNLSHIQAVKLLCVEKGKKDKTNLSFLAGNRLLKYVGQSFTREKLLTGILKGPAEKHGELADKATKGFKMSQKTCNQAMREIATLEAKLFNQDPNKDVIFVKHKKDGDNDYVSVLIGELENPSLPKLITVGDDKEGGMFVLAGTEQLLTDMGAKICEVFEGKGAPTKTMFRGRATKLGNRGKAETLLREYLKGLSSES